MRHAGPIARNARWVGIVAAAGCVVSVGFASVAYNLVGSGPAKGAATKGMLGTIQNAIKAYQVDKGMLPQTLADLQAGGKLCYLDPEKELRDAWGREFVYKPILSDGRPYQLFSKGPDGRFTSADDVDVWKAVIGE